jgi:protein TIF31
LDGSNLKDFYYLACGEEDGLYEQDEHQGEISPEPMDPSKNSKKNKGKKKDKDTDHADEDADEKSSGKSMKEAVTHLNELEAKTRVNCSIRFSGFHPPPRFRRLMGDLCYLEVTTPGEPVLNISAVPTGFYVNRSSIVNGSYKFDPSPAAKHFFSHELLDCLLQASDFIRSAWEAALNASKERAEQMAAISRDKPLYSLQRVAVRGNYGGVQGSFATSASQGIDSIVLRPSWLIPMPRKAKGEDAWNHNSLHDYNPARMEDELSSSFGLDIRNGAARDWNEELQGAREMPVSSSQERLERARYGFIYTLLQDIACCCF